MSTRKSFLARSILSALTAFYSENLLASSRKEMRHTRNSALVLSTWDFGKAANAAAWEVLAKGGHALDAVEAGIRVPEADPSNQSVGFGGLPDRDGHVTLDACIMDDKLNCGSVMCLEHITHAISVARLVMEKTPHIILSGEGALDFALANGFKHEHLLTAKSERDWKNWLKSSHYRPVVNVENKGFPDPGGRANHDTIGMIAMDNTGNLSGGCSTSGMAFKMRGRVGDSPVIGAGLYVDNEVGAATATGVGEEVIRVAGSHLIVEFMRQGLSPEDACKEGVKRISKASPERSKTLQVGFLAMNTKGQYGAYCLQPGFTYAVKSSSEEKIYSAQSMY